MIGTIFYDDEEYSVKAEWCNNNNCHIEEIDPDENGRRFTIVENPKPTEEDELNLLRLQREEECFPYINRGELWYDNLTQEQRIELSVWYQAWLDVTETKIIPTKPSWLD